MSLRFARAKTRKRGWKVRKVRTVPGKTRSLVRVCVLTALGREAALARELKRTTATQQELREAVLQTYLFAGFPRAINGLWVINDVLGVATPWRDREKPKYFLKRGEGLCRRIYGRDYEPMMRNMNRLHPDLAEWILAEGYGKTLSRAYFDAATRELLVVPVLVALECWRQLPSHLKGLVNVGGAKRDALAALEAARDLIPAASMKRATSLVSKLV